MARRAAARGTQPLAKPAAPLTPPRPLRLRAPACSLYSVDMLASCAYLVQDVDECSLQECECLPCDDDEVPAYMLERDSEEFEFALDGWARWDMPTDAYYDLRAYPEAYTRYNGTQVWEFIHRKLCFKGVASWKRDFNRAVGGLHSAISGQVVRSMDEEGEHEFALREYRRRLREQPGAVENLYYGAMLLLNACNEASERLVAYDYGEPKVNEQLSQLLAIPLLCGGCVGAAQNNLRRHASWQGGVGLWQARLRARDLMRIMNCVQCSVCRCARQSRPNPRARPARACAAPRPLPHAAAPPDRVPAAVHAAPAPRARAPAGCTARWARSASTRACRSCSGRRGAGATRRACTASRSRRSSRRCASSSRRSRQCVGWRRSWRPLG